MHAQDTYALDVIICMSARKKAPVNLLRCPFELYMFIGVFMQLRAVFKVLIPYCWSVALGKKKRRKPWREGELNHRRTSISLKSPMPYPSPTVTLKLHCEQFWTFIVIVTFDLLRTLLRMRAYELTDKDNYI